MPPPSDDPTPSAQEESDSSRNHPGTGSSETTRLFGRKDVLALLAAAAVPGAAVVALWTALLLVVGPGRVALSDGMLAAAFAPGQVPLALWEWALVALAVAATGYAAAVACSATLLVSFGARLGVHASAGAALRYAAIARPWPMLGFLALVSAALGLGAGLGLWAAATVNTGLGLATAALVFTLLVVPLMHAAALAELDSTGLWRGLRRFPQYLGERMLLRALALGLLPVLAALVLALLRWALRPLGQEEWWIALSATGLIHLALFALLVLLTALTAVLLTRHVLKETEARALPLTGGGRPRSRVTAAGVLTAVIAAPLLLPAGLWALPTVPSYSTQATTFESLHPPRAPPTVRTLDSGDLRISVGTTEFYCDPVCEPPPSDVTDADHHPGAPGGTTRAEWVAEEGEYTLRTYEECLHRECQAQTHSLLSLPRESVRFQPEDAQLGAAVVEHQDTVHVFSFAPAEDNTHLDIRRHTCPGGDCTDADQTELGTTAIHFTDRQGFEYYDAAVDAQGRPAVSVFDPHDGSVMLFTCSDQQCAERQEELVVPPTNFSDTDYEATHDPDTTPGARVEVRPDGTPVVAYRSALDGSARILDCADPACTDAKERVLSEPGWQQQLPSLALDSAGRPVLALNDILTGTISLVVCADQGCEDAETVPLSTARAAWENADLVLDEADRPIVVAHAQPGWLYTQEEEDLDEATVLVHRCDLPACGISR